MVLPIIPAGVDSTNHPSDDAPLPIQLSYRCDRFRILTYATRSGITPVPIVFYDLRPELGSRMLEAFALLHALFDLDLDLLPSVREGEGLPRNGS